MKKLFDLFVFGIVFALFVHGCKMSYYTLSPITHFIKISDFVLLDSSTVQVGYVIRKNKRSLRGDFNFRYSCKKNGVYVNSPELNIVHENIPLHSTGDDYDRINIEAPLPISANGECEVFTNAYIYINEKKRHYGQFYNRFVIEKPQTIESKKQLNNN